MTRKKQQHIFSDARGNLATVKPVGHGEGATKKVMVNMKSSHYHSEGECFLWLTPDEARDMAVALVDAAEECE